MKNINTILDKLYRKRGQKDQRDVPSLGSRYPVQLGEKDWCFVETAHVVGGSLVLVGWSSITPEIFVPGSEQQFRLLDSLERPDVARHLESQGLTGISATHLGFVAEVETEEAFPQVEVRSGQERVVCVLPVYSPPDASVFALLDAAIQNAPLRTMRHPDSWKIDNLFDANFYLAGFAPGERPTDPASHYLSEGWKQGRHPTPWFSTEHYLAMNPDVTSAGMNGFLHYCVSGHSEGRKLVIVGREAQADIYAAHAFAVEPGPHFEEFDPTIGVGRRKRAKVLAFYLPQFHPVEVNDRQWGTGFTEWRQLPRGIPRFEGHIQPRIPRDQGFYSLAEGDAMRRQIEMAQAAGLYGFCFYHYWFDGKRELETPMERLLADPTLDFPFCLIWANENWTRTWDGSEKEVILAQRYREEDDVLFVDDLARHMRDARYIRLGDRPLFFIYRPGQIPDSSATIGRWRALLKERHDLDPIIMMAQGFDDLDPGTHDLDGAIEFPPHKICEGLPPINVTLDMLDPGYQGHVFSYDAMVERSCREVSTEFPLIRTVTPAWDNEARRPRGGMVLHGSTPQKFSDWVDRMIDFAQVNPVQGEQIICVNAWNE